MVGTRSAKRKAIDSHQATTKKQRTAYDEDKTIIDLGRLNKSMKGRTAKNASHPQTKITSERKDNPSILDNRRQHSTQRKPHAPARGRPRKHKAAEDTSTEVERDADQDRNTNKHPSISGDTEGDVPDDALHTNPKTVQHDFEADVKTSHDYFEQHPEHEANQDDILPKEPKLSSVTSPLDPEPLLQALAKIRQKCWLHDPGEEANPPNPIQTIARRMTQSLERIRRFLISAPKCSNTNDQRSFYQRHAQHFGYILAGLDQAIADAENQNMAEVCDWEDEDWCSWKQLNDDIATIVFPTSLKILEQAWGPGQTNNPGFSIDTINIMTQYFRRAQKLYNEVVRRFEISKEESDRQKRQGTFEPLAKVYKQDEDIHKRRKQLAEKLAKLSKVLEDGPSKVHDKVQQIEKAKARRQYEEIREREYREEERRIKADRQRRLEQQIKEQIELYKRDFRNPKASQYEPRNQMRLQPGSGSVSSAKGSAYLARLLERWSPEEQNAVILAIDKNYPHMADCNRIAGDLGKDVSEVEAMIRCLLPSTLQYIFPGLSVAQVNSKCVMVLGGLKRA